MKNFIFMKVPERNRMASVIRAGDAVGQVSHERNE